LAFPFFLSLSWSIASSGLYRGAIFAASISVVSSQPTRLVADPELSPLDLAIAPNGNIVVDSERPFGTADAVTSVREYESL
jgi:hypothetical protein